MRNLVLAFTAVAVLAEPLFSQSLRLELAGGSVIERLPDGDYRVSYRVADQTKSFTLVTATKVVASIETEVTYDPRGGLYTYRYRIANAPAAGQPLFSASFSMMFPVQLAEAPPGWEAMETPRVSRVAWYRRPTGSIQDGIRPGESVRDFVVASPNVPAPTEVRVKGNAPPMELPESLPTDLYKRLDEMLILRNYLQTWAITPSLPAASNEPEASVAVLTSRVFGAYHRALDRSGHPRKDEIMAALWQAVQTLEHDESAGRKQLDEVRRLAAQAGDSSWPTQLGRALVLALEHATSRSR